MNKIYKSLIIAYSFFYSFLKREVYFVSEQLLMIILLISFGILSKSVFGFSKIDALTLYWSGYFSSFSVANYIRQKLSSLSLRKYGGYSSPVLPGFIFLFVPVVIIIKSIIITFFSCLMLPYCMDFLCISYSNMGYTIYPLQISIDFYDILSSINMVVCLSYCHIIKALNKGNFYIQTIIFPTLLGPVIQMFADADIGRLSLIKTWSAVYIGNNLIFNNIFYWLILYYITNLICSFFLDASTQSNNI